MFGVRRLVAAAAVTTLAIGLTLASGAAAASCPATAGAGSRTGRASSHHDRYEHRGHRWWWYGSDGAAGVGSGTAGSGSQGGAGSPSQGGSGGQGGTVGSGPTGSAGSPSQGGSGGQGGTVGSGATGSAGQGSAGASSGGAGGTDESGGQGGTASGGGSTGTAAAAPTSSDQEVLSLINQARAQAGLGALVLNTELQALALKKAEDMIQYDYFSDTSPDLGTPAQMEAAAGYEAAYMGGEDVAEAGSVDQAWVLFETSAPHWQNIVDPDYTQAGIAVVPDGSSLIVEILFSGTPA